MSFNHNYVSLAGNLTRDPELRTTSANPVTAFALAINRQFRDREGTAREETTFVDCETWGRNAENVARYLRKGSPAFVEGRLKLDTWDDAAGKRHSRLRVVATRVQFLASGRPRAEDAATRPPEPVAAGTPAEDDPGAAFEEGEPPF